MSLKSKQFPDPTELARNASAIATKGLAPMVALTAALGSVSKPFKTFLSTPSSILEAAKNKVAEQFLSTLSSHFGLISASGELELVFDCVDVFPDGEYKLAKSKGKTVTMVVGSRDGHNVVHLKVTHE